MDPKVQADLLSTIASSIAALSQKDFTMLDELSNTTIHNASIFQDEDSIDIALVLYAAAKVLETHPDFSKVLKAELISALKLIKKGKVKQYKRVIENILAKIKRIDQKVDQYITHVISQARIKKGSKLYSHGISLTQSASLLGISLWELYNYIGKTTVSDQVEDATAATKRRLEYARSLFATQYANKQMVFDAGPVITLAITSLLYVLPRLKELSHASFFVPSAVYGELIDQPMTTRMHKLESFQVLPYFINDTLHVMRTRMLEDTTTQLLTLANSIYVVDGNPLTLVHTGEMHALALLVITQSRTFVVDERTTRMLLETPMHLRDHLQDKLHAKVEVNKENLTKFSDMTKHIRTIRSAELLVVGYELGMFEPEFLAIGAQDRMKREFLKGALWAIKLAGCTISEDEIKYLVKNAKHR